MSCKPCKTLIRCKNCLMAETKPGLILNDDGVCQACLHYDNRKNVDWTDRYKQLQELCNQYRGKGQYDCIIPVSGGKDSYTQVKVIRNDLGMNPLLVNVTDPFTHTKAGIHNFDNLRERFNCDCIQLQLSPDLVRRMCRIAFEELGSPTWPIDRAIYTFPIRTAIEKKIPLVIYGENVSYEYGGYQNEETPSAFEQINNDVAKKVDWSLWTDRGIKWKELGQLIYPIKDWESLYTVNPIYLSYYLPWDGYYNRGIAKVYGFKDLLDTKEWYRKGYIEGYDQIDSIGYLFNAWMKYPKYGFQRTTDVVGYWVRANEVNKDHGGELIDLHDYKLDRKIWEDFISFCGYTEDEAWEIVKKHDCGYTKEMNYHVT